MPLPSGLYCAGELFFFELLQMSSYIEHFMKSSEDLPEDVKSSLRTIEKLDNAVEGKTSCPY